MQSFSQESRENFTQYLKPSDIYSRSLIKAAQDHYFLINKDCNDAPNDVVFLEPKFYPMIVPQFKDSETHPSKGV